MGTRWAAGLASLAVLAGACVLGVTLTSGSGPQTASAAVAARAAGHAGRNGARGSDQGTAASSTSSDSSNGALQPGLAGRRIISRLRACFASARRLRASGQRAAAWTELRACVRRYLRLRVGVAFLRLHRLRMLIRRMLHGQITVRTPNGPKTLVFERGAIQSVSGSSLVVKSTDGTILTWRITAATRVIKARHLIGASALAAGQRVVIVGDVAGGLDQARRVLIRS